MSKNIQRYFSIPDGHSVFVWGPRRTGKSWWIRKNLKAARLVDLLKSDVFAEYASRPALFRERVISAEWMRGMDTVVIDEIQRVPALLDEVHWLIENKGIRFVLTGSSARKLRRCHANLLAGRAWRREMRPVCLAEVVAAGDGLSMVDLERIMKSGMLPPHYLSSSVDEELRAYVGDYLREEIAAETVVRNLPAFADFLRVAALSSSELLNCTNVARDVGVSAKVVRGYFEILEDTMLGFRIQPWRKSRTRRMIQAEKFYLFDVGVAHHLAHRTALAGTPEFGKGFEQLVLQELLAYKSYRAPDLELRYWRTSTGQEVDFVIDDLRLAVEVKASARIHPGDLRGLRALAEDGPVGRRIVVTAHGEPAVIEDGPGNIEVLPISHFVQALWGGMLLR